MAVVISNRTRANWFLAISFLLFLFCACLRTVYPDSLFLKGLLALVEAALVGGIADWFAVTALFRKPLGFAWHTALIPRKRAQLAEITAQMVQEELVSVTAIQQRLQSVRFMALIVELLERKDVKQLFGNFLLSLVREGLTDISPAELAVRLESLLKQYAREFALAPLALEAGQWALAEHKDDELLDFLLAEMAVQAGRPAVRQYIYNYMEARKEEAGKASALNRIFIWLGEQVNALNVAEAAGATAAQLAATLTELRDPEHPTRQWLRGQLQEMLVELNVRDDWAAMLEKWKNDLIERTSLLEPLTKLLELVMLAVTPQLRSSTLPGEEFLPDIPVHNSPLVLWLLAQLDRYWHSFRENKELQAWVEIYLREAVYKLAETEHAIVGVIVKDALNSFSDEDLNRFVEDKAGDDLQWIRINGSVVGAIVGLLLFLLLHWLYEPSVLAVFSG